MSPIYFVTIILFLIAKRTTAKSSPVLVYGIKLPPQPVFPQITKDDFKQKMGDYIRKNTFFLILIKNFRARQLACKDTRVKCLDEYPHNLDFTYFGAVENPYQALEELFTAKGEPIFVDKTGKLKSTVNCELTKREQLNIVQIEDARRRRDADQALLQQRTTILSEIKQHMEGCERPPLFFLMDPTSDGIEYDNDGDESTLLVKSMSTTVLDNMIIIDVATKAHKLFEDTDSALKNLTIKIVKKPGLHTLVNATYDGEEYIGHTLEWPTEFMLDAPGIVFTSGKKKLRINQVKLERFSTIENATKGLEYSTKDWYTCVYFTPGIMMGLFVVAILGTIMFYGLSMIMNIKTNDRFDGPHMQGLTFGTTAEN